MSKLKRWFSALRLNQTREDSFEITNGVNHKRLLSFKDRHKGQRVFIIGNGPSLNKTDLSLLKDEVTIGCNGLFLIYDKMGFLPTYYTVEDTLVAEDRADVINRMHGTTKVFPSDLKYCLMPDEDTVYINFIRPGYKNFPQFSEEFASHVYWGGTVTFLNIQLAWYLGSREVYLVGVDHSYQGAKEEDEKEKFTVTSRTSDVDHFHPDYFGPGFRYHDPNVERMEQGYVKAKEIFDKNGRRIYNATAGGKLEVYERADYNSLFSGKK